MGWETVNGRHGHVRLAGGCALVFPLPGGEEGKREMELTGIALILPGSPLRDILILWEYGGGVEAGRTVRTAERTAVKVAPDAC